jgi:pimeloyl-ACP methyl ester carboxylesterase
MTLSMVAGGRRLEYAWIGPAPGAAPTLVFLHEGLGSLTAWRDFPAALAAATGLGALVYSRAGYGGSDPAELPRPVRFMHDEAEVLGEVLDATGVRDAVLVGHSDGASIAIIHAGSVAGTRVRALVLEAPHVFTEPEGLASIARIADTYRTTDLPLRLAKYHGSNTEGAFWGWNRVWLDPEFRAWNIEEYLGSIRVPTLVIQGEDDEYGTMRQVDATRHQLAGPAEILILPDCGHTPHRDQRERVLAEMARFIQASVDTHREASA